MSSQISHPAAGRRHEGGATVTLDVGTVDRVIDDLVALKLVLASCAEADHQVVRGRVDEVARRLDQVIGRLQHPALAHPAPNPGGTESCRPELLAAQMRQTLATAAEFAHGGRGDPPSTVELLDAAHSVQRALVALRQTEARL
jgi:hypothetical protein